jgi:hypothetical protein
MTASTILPLAGSGTPSKSPPPSVGHSTMRQLQALGAASRVTQEDVATWFG